jgi:hypothetical protein
MTHLGGPGPTIRERRPKALRPCLSCGRRIRTSIATRLCAACSVRAASLAIGFAEVNIFATLSRGRRV